ncbi:hypothetical protein [Alkalibacillus aidingensis]|uniref:hypothetical protein n=1 Tax=Alkalibacillus aidingensis TaxID=2747607 RepID=UPI0016609258|nr:hypothetical protein [Alkalibacillus aidingensis]
MRLIGWLVVIFIVFQMGVQFGQGNDESETPVIEKEEQIEAEIEEKTKNQDSDSFLERHEEVIASSDEVQEGQQTGLFSVASVLESYVKQIFTFLFHIFYRLADTFGI